MVSIFADLESNFCFLNLFGSKHQLFLLCFFERSPILLLLLLTAQLELVCNDAILTSSGSARGGYMDVRSAARHKQHATEQLFTKSYTNNLKQNFIWFATTRSSPLAAPPEGGYLEVRSAARHKQHATEQLFTKSYTNAF